MKNKVFANASLVTVLSVAERGLGFLYRIVLSRLLGAEGLGMYQVALSVFALFLTIGTGGIPLTVSKTVTQSLANKQEKTAREYLSSGVALSLIITLPICLVFGIFGTGFSFLFTDAQTANVFKILLVGLCFSCAYAALRGYFWGMRNFFLPAILDIVEETAMVIVGVLLLQTVPSPALGAQKAAWAVVVSYLLSFACMLFAFLIKGGRFTHPKKTLKPLFNASLPITSVRASSSLVNSAVAVLFPIMLVKSGVSQSEALTLFGIVSGMVIPVLFIPSTFISSLSLVLIPELSEDSFTKNYTRLRKNVLRGLRFAVLVACALIPFFFAIGEEIGSFAFANATAGKLIKSGCPILLPMCLGIISTGMLNALGYEKRTFVHYFIGAAAMLACILFLPSVFGVYAYLIGLGASFVFTAAFNLIFLCKQYKIFTKGVGQVCVHSFFIPLFTTFPLSIFGRFCLHLFQGFLGETISLFATSGVLAVLLVILFWFCGVLPPVPKRKSNK